MALTGSSPARSTNRGAHGFESRQGGGFRHWLARQTPAWRLAVNASLDPFRCYATALTSQLPQAARVRGDVGGDVLQPAG